jgi:Tfp pilus assembly protein PilX
MTARRDFIRDERGVAMLLVLFVVTLVSLIALFLINTVTGESNRSAHAVWRGASFQAAEAGIDDYISKLVDDRGYFLHYVHPGEATREEPGGNVVAAGTAWTYDLTWTYPNGSDAWRQLSNGYEYSLQVTPPSAASPYVRIVATGRKAGSTTDQRVIETLVRPSSLADFYRVVNGDVGWGAGATTNGKIYANGNIDHDGTATANMYAEGNITGSYTLLNGAQTYDHNTIRTQIKNPINFNNFLTSFVDIQRASQLGGIYLDDPSKAGWRLTFQSGGTVSVQSCLRTGGNDIADVAPTCAGATSYPVPANGAIYTAQNAIVSGAVNGRVTIASNDDIVVAGDISYVSTSDDVLGLAAKNDVVIARWVPYNLTWNASVLAQSGTWKTYTQDGSHGNMLFRGSSATNLGGSLTMFQTRDYGYLPSLQYLPPPWFPTIEEAYTVVLFRELPPPSS